MKKLIWKTTIIHRCEILIDVKDLKVCSDCGTVYYDKFSRGVCPNCHTNNYEQLSADSGIGSLERWL